MQFSQTILNIEKCIKIYYIKVKHNKKVGKHLDDKIKYLTQLDYAQKNKFNYYMEVLSSQLIELLEKDISLQDMFQQLHLQNEKIIMNLSIDLTADAVPLHSHSFYEIIFVLDGKVDYLIGSRSYVLQGGDVVIIPPGIPHQPLISESLSNPYKRYSLWIDTSYLEDVLKKYPDAGLALQESNANQKYLIRTHEHISRNLRTHFEAIYHESCELRPGWKLCIATETLNLVVQMGRIYHNNEALEHIGTNDSMMDNIFAYINTHLSEKITLDSVANYFHISKSKISHMFQQQIGISFYQYIIQIRLLSAKIAITQGLSLTEACHRYGFSEYSSFYRLFKKEYGISPKEYFSLQQQLKR